MRYVSVFGDSISTFEGYAPDGYAVFYEGSRRGVSGVVDVTQTWWARVIDALDATLLANASWSGSMVEGVGFPAGDSQERVAALSRDDIAPDDVLVFCGINDYGWGGPLNQAAGRSASVPFALVEQDALPPQADAADAPDDAASNFGAAYASMLTRMRSLYPTARIWCFTPVPGRVKGCTRSTFTYSHRGVAFADYIDALARAAHAQGAILCDLTAYGFEYEGVEGTHPTALGMEQIAWLALRSMLDARPDVVPFTLNDLGEYPGGDAFRSDDPCDAPGKSCAGCAHTLGTGNRWMLVCRRREPVSDDVLTVWD